MSNRRIIISILAIISLTALDNIAFSTELPHLINLSLLELEITNTEVAEKITANFGLEFVTLSAKEGYKLVIVTLKGTVPSPCQISSETHEFTAVYVKKSGIPELGTELGIIHSCALAIGNN